MIEWALPLILLAGASYVGARFAMLSGWSMLAGALRLFALWLAAAWVGYGTPVYMGVAVIVLGVLWAQLRRTLVGLLLFEVGLVAYLVWLSEATVVPVYVVALLIADQCFARVLLTRFDRQREARVGLHRVIVIVSMLTGVAASYHLFHATVERYAASHSLRQMANLMPQGAAPLWFSKRQLTGERAGRAVAGSVYWQARYPESSERCAISFHGAARPGSLQSTARTIARGVERAQVRLYAVDHPGFGQSPVPARNAAVDAWDPAHLTSAVLSEMRRSGCSQITALGHSQGVTEALRLLVSNLPSLSEVIVLGAGLYDEDADSDAYWYERFHIDRSIPAADQVDEARWRLIRELYYLNQEYCASTTAGRGYREIKAFNFVQFEHEHPNLVATREPLFACLSYPNRSRSLMPTDHYMDSAQVGDLMFIQRRSIDAVSGLLPAAPSSLISE